MAYSSGANPGMEKLAFSAVRAMATSNPIVYASSVKYAAMVRSGRKGRCRGLNRNRPDRSLRGSWYSRYIAKPMRNGRRMSGGTNTRTFYCSVLQVRWSLTASAAPIGRFLNPYVVPDSASYASYLAYRPCCWPSSANRRSGVALVPAAKLRCS